jgi:outer membrane protein OmpA-like peptidoglycan-associated protein
VLAGVRWVKHPRTKHAIAPVPEPVPEPEPEPEPEPPDLDQDDDGIEDASDGCPTDAEDVDKFEDEDGCPELDNDVDGLADAVDPCPDDAEIVNGYQDDDGCPDDPPKIQVSAEDVGLDETIYFDLNKAKIKQRSRKLLQAIVDALEAIPDVRVRVEGHTDDTGDAAWNQQLSEDRAAAVRDYLIEQGIPADRLEVAGYGNTRPKVENASDKTRAKNRRVEFVIID